MQEEPFFDPWNEIIEVMDLRNAIAELPERDQSILRLWSHGYTQVEIGNQVGLSQQRVSQRLKESVSDLRSLLAQTITCEPDASRL